MRRAARRLRARAAARRLRRSGGPDRDRPHLAATSNTHYLQLAWDVPTDICVRPAGRGRDVADRYLLEQVDPAFVARRFDRVVIGSGDGIFTELAARLRRHDCKVWVVAYSWTLSSRLARAADRAVELDRVHGPAPLAA